MRYVIGIEGGGTKSRAAALSSDRKILGRARGTGMNLQNTPEERLKETLTHLVDRFRTRLGRPAGLCAGLAGCDRSEDKRKLKAILKGLFPGIPAMAESDARVALFGAFEEEPGVLVISGTGSVAIGQDGQGRVARAGGWGYLLGDEGSGFSIGREALRACLSGRKTKLESLVRKALKVKRAEQVIPWIHAQEDVPKTLAWVAPLVFQAASQHDPAAVEILEAAASALSDLCFDTSEALNLERPRAAFLGGLISRPTPLARRLRELLEQKFLLVRPRNDPVTGAALLALRTFLRPRP
jgi:N-acetylglucosamine kinase-like BadF-type ATPase